MLVLIQKQNTIQTVVIAQNAIDGINNVMHGTPFQKDFIERAEKTDFNINFEWDNKS